MHVLVAVERLRAPPHRHLVVARTSEDVARASGSALLRATTAQIDVTHCNDPLAAAARRGRRGPSYRVVSSCRRVVVSSCRVVVVVVTVSEQPYAPGPGRGEMESRYAILCAAAGARQTRRE